MASSVDRLVLNPNGEGPGWLGWNQFLKALHQNGGECNRVVVATKR